MRFDVVKDYDWTVIPRGSGLRGKAPRVWVKSYKLKSNNVLNRFQNYLEVLSIQDADEFYSKLYGDISTPEDDFNFPFFNDNIRSFSNTFGDTFQNGFGNGGGIGTAADAGIQAILGNLAQLGSLAGSDAISEAQGLFSKGEYLAAGRALASGAAKGEGDPGSYIETPKFYQYEQNDGPLDVTFVLSNTINDDYMKNHELVKKLTKINRPFRKNSIAMDPPRIYQVKVPGQRFIKWAYCSNFSINLMGTKREMDGIIIPEAYQITLSFTSLTVEASNFMDKV